jgi:DNA segregation ATPase FtsK/SpoIIIE, S-DNA-T family
VHPPSSPSSPSVDPVDPPARRPLPLFAALAPLAGGIVLWVATGSPLSLWLAALAPVMLGASALDARRAERRERRGARARRRADDARHAERIAAAHAAERARLRARHPDVAAFHAPDAPVWRSGDDLERIVLGRGRRPSALRVGGGAADDGWRDRAAVLDDAPDTVRADAGIAVSGPPGLAAAVVRALVLQAALAVPPDALRVDARASAEHPWIAHLPHAATRAPRTLAVIDPGGAVPADAEVVIARVEPGAPPPPRCRAVVTLTGPAEAEAAVGGERRALRVEGVGEGQAERIARALAARHAAVARPARTEPPVALSALLPDAPSAEPGRLPAVLGLAEGRPCVVDLVADGPHAVVVGVTGSGKSELLVTWVAALAAAHTPHEVVFLLADFKGGTAFRALAGLPHVTGVLTDLDADAARRAFESLRAEVRTREAVLARAGARDVGDPGVGLPRLVIVVDEFAALGEQHPELLAVFADVAARGRALGMHLILGTQRATGVLRDALLANCPLRVGLRMTDPADSRAVLGTDEAARLPGSPAERGRALVRRGGDAVPEHLRVARTAPGDLERARGADGPPARRSWVPPLPERLTLAEVGAAPEPGDLVLGLADEPDRQRHAPVLLRARERGLLVLGTSGAGKSAVLELAATQSTAPARVVGPDLEQAWDAVEALADDPSPAAGELVLVDDLDGLLLRYPPEYAQTFLERVELVVRGAGGGGRRVLITAQRLGGGAARVADLFPRRALLPMATRADYLAAGGGPALRPGSVPGRAVIDGRVVQFAAPETGLARRGGSVAPWDATGVVGMVLRPGASARARADALARRGLRVVPVQEARDLREHPGGEGLVVVGGPEAWQQEWRVLVTLRERHDLVIDAACGGDYRLVSGQRELPPFCAPGASRAWLLRRGAPPVRTTLPAVA